MLLTNSNYFSKPIHTNQSWSASNESHQLKEHTKLNLQMNSHISVQALSCCRSARCFFMCYPETKAHGLLDRSQVTFIVQVKLILTREDKRICVIPIITCLFIEYIPGAANVHFSRSI